jgi:hypothetical protein
VKKIIVIAVVVVAIGAIAFLMPSEGQREFKKQIEALDGVHSWKMDLQVSANSRMVAQRLHEAQCPDMEQITELGPENDVRYIRMANLVYYKKNGAGWIQEANVPQDLFLPIVTPRPCMSNPGGTTTSADSGAVEWRTELSRAIKDGTFHKGDLETVNGSICRDWQVSWTNLRNQLVAYTMCISEQDHLPRRVQMLRENVNMYFKWNVPVEVQAPESSSLPEPPVTEPAPAEESIPDSVPSPRKPIITPDGKRILPT